MKNIAIVTPLRDEINNIPRLINSLCSQSMTIFAWIIVENDSTDGSREYLSKITALKNVQHFKVINYSHFNKTYQLGTKYASIVDLGFSFLKKAPFWKDVDYLGILDSDCFPKDNYYKGLVSFMEADEKLGISSGQALIDDSTTDITSKNWVKGNCRLWKISCFNDSGYIIGPSADTLSAAKALLRGWTVYPSKELFFETREQGERSDFSYYGYSAYFRGHTVVFCLLKSVYLYVVKRKPKSSYQYFKGYFQSLLKGEKRIEDEEIRTFFRRYLEHKIKQHFK